MSKTYFFKITLSLFLFSVLFAATISAQTSSCAVKMEVSRYNTGTLIAGVSARAVNEETKKVYRSVLKDGQPYFAKLPAGDYRVTVSRSGYMRSADDFSLDCSEDNDEFSWDVELYKGNSKLLVKIYNRPQPIATQPKRLVIGTVLGDSNTTVPPANPSTSDLPLSPVPKIVNGGIVNGKATGLVKPAYPAAARALRAGGVVHVQVTIDESGKVIFANAVSGHPLLRDVAVAAAKASTFSPTLLSGRPVKVSGVILYNFVAP